MPVKKIELERMREAHEVLCEFPFEIKQLDKGYADRSLRIDLDKNEITVHPVTRQMKDLWTGGKGLDLWLMFREIDRDTKWDSHENPLCFSSGPLGGTTSFPGSGKTLVTSVSPLTHSVIDCNVGGYFGPFLKFAGFDALVIVGKAAEDSIVFIDAVNKKITVDKAPRESLDSHLLAEELTEMYADDDLDKRNIAVVSAGRGARYTRMGVLNFSFWDWRRNVARLKQAGRGGVGTVFRDKKLKALVIKNRNIKPAWRVQENKVAKWATPKKISTQCGGEIAELDAAIEKWGNDPEFVFEMMQDIQDRFRHISRTAIERLLAKTGVPKAYLYHIATFDKGLSLEEKEPAAGKAGSPVEVIQSSKQQFVVLPVERAVDPENIEHYIAGGGYQALGKVLAEGKPGSIIREVTGSGLRDRLDGSLVGVTWESAFNAKKERNEGIYIVGGAGEGGPGACVSRGILEAAPHSVIEGMVIGAYAAGAKEGFIAIRKEHVLAGERLDKAIEAARQKGFLGERIRGSDFCFDIRIHRIGGASVSGESTSLITAMSGRAGESQPKYIPIGEKGFRDKPTVVNNVETWANIPVIIEKGAGWFSAIGVKGSTGTKVFFLTGDAGNGGLVEVPMGTSLREIVTEIGAVGSNDGKHKAVRIGGAAGGFIPANLWDTKLDFDSLSQAGAIMGSGAIQVLGDAACLAGEALDAVEFLSEESCGKCTPCREGLYALKEILTRICSGAGKPGDIELLEEIAKTMFDTSLCRFGVYAATPVLSSLRYFGDEYREHIGQRKCRAGVCKLEA